MKHSHASHAMGQSNAHGMTGHAMRAAQEHSPAVGEKVALGAMSTATLKTGEKLMSKMAKHPLLVFGLGVVAGIVVYKYRKEIIANANKALDVGKDFVLNQKENLEDLVAESQEDDS